MSAFVRSRRDIVVVYTAALALFVYGAVAVGNFLTGFNLKSAIGAGVALALVAIGQTLVILTGGIDLSVGSAMNLVTVVGALYMNGHDGRLPLGILMCLGIGAGVGLLNGIVVTFLRVQPIIATLGTLSIIQGATLFRSNTPGGFAPPLLQATSYGNFGPFPQSLVIVAGVFLAGFFLLRATRFGGHLYAVGASEDGARRSGVHTARVKLAVYTLGGLFTGAAGLMLMGRLGTGDPTAGQVFLLTSVAAVAIGGTSLFGGRGGLAGTLGGVVILTLLNNVLTLQGVGTYPQQLITGILIFAVVAFYSATNVTVRQSLLRRLALARKALSSAA